MIRPLHPLDWALQEHAPAVMVPRYGELPPLGRNRHRFLVARDGVWLELHRPWLHLRWPVCVIPYACGEHFALPYGSACGQPHTDFAFTPEQILALEAAFLRDARAALPDEYAAWGVWDDTARTLLYRPCVALAGTSPSGVRYARPVLLPHEHLAIDLHSHAHQPAFFSATDDADDRGEVKVALVAGNLRGIAAWAARLCVLGISVDIDTTEIET